MSGNTSIRNDVGEALIHHQLQNWKMHSALGPEMLISHCQGRISLQISRAALSKVGMD